MYTDYIGIIILYTHAAVDATIKSLLINFSDSVHEDFYSVICLKSFLRYRTKVYRLNYGKIIIIKKGKICSTQ